MARRRSERWFHVGFSGDPARCDTFQADPL